MENEIVIFETEDKKISLTVTIEEECVAYKKSNGGII